MPVINVEGQEFSFPDGTSDEIIGNAIRGHFKTNVNSVADSAVNTQVNANITDNPVVNANNLGDNNGNINPSNSNINSSNNRPVSQPGNVGVQRQLGDGSSSVDFPLVDDDLNFLDQTNTVQDRPETVDAVQQRNTQADDSGTDNPVFLGGNISGDARRQRNSNGVRSGGGGGDVALDLADSNRNTRNLSLAGTGGRSGSAPKKQPESNKLEAAGSILAGAVAEPLAGLAGIAGAISSSLGLTEEGAGVRNIDAVRDLFSPNLSEGGKASLSEFAELLSPITDKIIATENGLGDFAFDLTGSPALAALAKSSPTIALEVLGLKSFRAGKKIDSPKEPKAVHAAPEIEEIKQAAAKIYGEIDNGGTTIKRGASRSLVNKINRSVLEKGIILDLPKPVRRSLRAINQRKGSELTMANIQGMLDVAKDLQSNIKPTIKRKGKIIQNQIISFLENLDPKMLKSGDALRDVTKLKSANALWGRARRSELLSDIVKDADISKHPAGHVEREIGKLLKSNNKNRKFFSKEELSILESAIQSKGKDKLLSVLGFFGASDSQFANLLKGAAITGGSFSAGSGGALSAIGTVAGVSASYMLGKFRNNARLTKLSKAESMIRAGPNADKITLAYQRNTPRRQRNTEDLTALMLNNNIDFSTAPKTGMAKKAFYAAQGLSILSIPAVKETNQRLLNEQNN
jgi:hypothetical protein